MDVFVLHHVHTFNDGSENVKFIGVYSTAQAAEQAVERMRVLPGFCDVPNGFQTDHYELDKDQWEEGYITVYYDDE